MNKNEKIVAGSSVAVGVLLAVGFSLNVVDSSDLLVGLFFTGFSGLAYFGYKRKWFESQLKNFQPGDDGYGDDWSDEEALEFVKEWSNRNYPDNDGVEFHWDNAEDATVRVSSGLEDVDMEKLYAVWTDYGPRNQGVQVFVNCTTKERLNHLKLRFKEQRFRPFVFCDYYHEAKDAARKMSGLEGRERSEITINSGGLPGDQLTRVDDLDGDGGGE